MGDLVRLQIIAQGLVRSADFDHVAARVPQDELRGAALHEDLAVVDDDQPVAEPGGLLHVVGREHDTQAAGLELLQPVPDLVTGLGVEPRGRLVQDQQFGAIDEGARQGEPADHAAREIHDFGAAAVGKRKEVEQLVCPGPGLPDRDRKIAGKNQQVLFHGQVRVQRVVLLADPDPGLDLAPVPGDVHLEDADDPPCRRRKPVEHPDGGGFTGAVRSEQPEKLARRHRERDAVNGGQVVEALEKMLDFDDGRHIKNGCSSARCVELDKAFSLQSIYLSSYKITTAPDMRFPGNPAGQTASPKARVQGARVSRSEAYTMYAAVRLRRTRRSAIRRRRKSGFRRSRHFSAVMGPAYPVISTYPLPSTGLPPLLPLTETLPSQ